MNMRVNLTSDQEAFVRHGIESGRFASAEDAVQQALAQWEERERARASILSNIDQAEGSLSRGNGRPITGDSMRKLARDIKQRGRARLAAETVRRAR